MEDIVSNVEKFLTYNCECERELRLKSNKPVDKEKYFVDGKYIVHICTGAHTFCHRDKEKCIGFKRRTE